MSRRTLFSKVIRNPQYAPGIATYGIDGKDGSIGTPGNSIFYSQFSFSDVNRYQTIIEKIKQNQLMAVISAPAGSRNYIDGDIFVDPEGKFYRLRNLTEISQSTNYEFSHFLQQVGQISEQDDEDLNTMFIIGDNNRILNINQEGIDIVYGLSDVVMDSSSIAYIDNNFYAENTNTGVLRIIQGDEALDDNNNLNFVSMSSRFAVENENYLNLYYSKDYNAFVFDSNIPIVINTSTLEIRNSQSDEPVLDNYSRITTFASNVSRDYNTFANFNFEILNFGLDEEETQIRIFHVAGLDINNFIDPTSIRVSMYIQDNETGESIHYIKEFAQLSEDERQGYMLVEGNTDVQDYIGNSPAESQSTEPTIRTMSLVNEEISTSRPISSKIDSSILSRMKQVQSLRSGMSASIKSAQIISSNVQAATLQRSNTVKSDRISTISNIASNSLNSVSQFAASKASSVLGSKIVESKPVVNTSTYAIRSSLDVTIQDEISQTGSSKIIKTLSAKADASRNGTSSDWNSTSCSLVDSNEWLDKPQDTSSLTNSQLVNDYYWSTETIDASSYQEYVSIVTGEGDLTDLTFNTYIVKLPINPTSLLNKTMRVALLGRIEVFINEKTD